MKYSSQSAYYSKKPSTSLFMNLGPETGYLVRNFTVFFGPSRQNPG
jgi:hypothetical protein